jgi:hypothetical protein
MVNSTQQTNVNFTWQALLWRLLLTGLLLLALAGPGLSLFGQATVSSENSPRPALEFQSTP